MSPSLIELLTHIHKETEYLVAKIAEINFEEFRDDDDYNRSIIRSLEIIGEASKRIPDNFKIQHAEIDWKGLSGLRDKLIHHYFGVDYELVWDIVNNEVPPLNKFLKHLL